MKDKNSEMEIITNNKKTNEEDSLKMIIAKNIKQRRKNMGLKQHSIATKLGVVDNHISRIESGNHLISVNNLKLICEALNCKSTDILNF